MEIQLLMGVIFHNSLVPLFNSITQRYQGQLQFTEVFLMSLSPLLSILLFVFSLFPCYFPPCWINLAYQTLFPFSVLYSRDVCVDSKLQRTNSFCLLIVCCWCMNRQKTVCIFISSAELAGIRKGAGRTQANVTQWAGIPECIRRVSGRQA